MIARSFAFIFQRNMPNLGLLGFTMHDQECFLKPPRKEKRIASISILEPSASTDVPAFRGVDLHQEAERNSQARII